MTPNLPKQIWGSFEDIGKDVVGEIAKIPTDIAGKALESLGTSSGTKSQQGAKSTARSTVKEPSALDKLSNENDKQTKERLARAALEYVASGQVKKPKEPSIWERIQMEAEQKRDQQSQQRTAARNQMASPRPKRKRGDLFGAQAKQAATEKKAIRQD